MGAPLRWLGALAGPRLQRAVIAGFALSAWAMCLLVTRWTGSRAAGAVAGHRCFAFNAHTLTRLPHLQALHVEFLPLVLWPSTACSCERRRARRGLARRRRARCRG